MKEQSLIIENKKKEKKNIITYRAFTDDWAAPISSIDFLRKFKKKKNKKNQNEEKHYQCCCIIYLFSFCFHFYFAKIFFNLFISIFFFTISYSICGKKILFKKMFTNRTILWLVQPTNRHTILYNNIKFIQIFSFFLSLVFIEVEMKCLLAC